MSDPNKTEARLVEELQALRSRIAELERVELEHARANEALDESEARFRSLTEDVLDTGKDGVFVLDADFRVVWINQALERYFGLRREEVVGKDKRLLIRERVKGIFEESERFASRVLATYDNNTYVENFECHVLPGDRRDERWLEHWSRPIRSGYYAGGRIEQYTDITDRRHAAEALRKERDFSTSLVQASPTFFVAISPEGRTLMMNEAMLTALGYTEDEVLGTNYLETFVPEADRELLAKVFDELTRLNKPTLNENHVLAKNGDELLVEWHGRPVFKENGEVGYQFGVGIDITERRRLEEQFRQSQKMEALGLLAGGVAHDFHNLLTAVLGNAEFLLGKLRKEPAPDERYITCLGAIVNAGNRAVALTRQLLAFGRGQVVSPVALDLNTVLEGIEELLPQITGEHIKLTVKRQRDLCPIEADAAQIEQIIMNLVVNARDAMPRGGALTIETADVTLDEDYVAWHPRAHPGRHAALYVFDTGVGMSAETVDRIFEPFFTTKPVGEGTGLGLSTVFGIVKQARGHLTVESEEGKGTVFRVYLPAIDRPVESPTAEPTGSPIVRRELGGDETVLVCEDEESIRRMACEVLEYHGYKVLSAKDGQHGAQLAAQYDAPIHLLLTDVIMPEMNGYRLADALLAKRPAMQVLYMSGYSSDVLETEMVGGDRTELLEKPFTSNDLLIRVRDALDAKA
jgi:PAS domain S-box-containing protein